MDAEELKRYVSEQLGTVDPVDNSGDTFFFYEPSPERLFPFATLVTGDRYDTFSDLDPPGRYRLNIGLTKARYAELFGTATTAADYTVTDTLLPHPVYAGQHWVCVVNPGASTLDTVRTLLAEAYEFAARKHANQRARRAAGGT